EVAAAEQEGALQGAVQAQFGRQRQLVSLLEVAVAGSPHRNVEVDAGDILDLRVKQPDAAIHLPMGGRYPVSLELGAINLRFGQVVEFRSVDADVEHLLVLPDVEKHGTIEHERMIEPCGFQSQLECIECFRLERALWKWRVVGV